MRTQLTLDGLTCVERAVERLRLYEPSEGYFLCFSGGKDSVCIKAIAELAGVKYEAHYSVTTIDPPPIIRFIRQEHPDVTFNFSPYASSFAQGVIKQGWPMRRVRWCCREFKDYAGAGRIKVMGVRKAERRAARTGRGAVDMCARTGDRRVNPIWDWSDGEVWGFIRSRELPYCELYDKGWKRIGCVCCPFASAQEIRRNREAWPRMFRKIRRAFHAVYAKRVESNPEVVSRFHDADSCFEWWLSRGWGYPKPGDALYIPKPEWAKDSL